jgi:hypothetical protein
MITPSYSLTATERVLPRLALDFTTGVLDSRITFTRSTTATFTGSDGLIQSAAINAPRFDYNPSTLVCSGLLIEEQRTNLLLNSLIDGTTLSTQVVTVTAIIHTLSFYGTGTVTISGTHTAVVNGTGSYPSRTTYAFTPTAGALTLTVTGTVQFAQLEVGGFASSFIPTAASQVTRTVDVATMTGTNFSNWYNQSEGAFNVIWSAPLRANQTAFSAYVNNSNRFENYRNNAGQLRIIAYSGGALQSTTGTLTDTGVGPFDCVLAYKQDNMGIAVNGGAVGVDTSCLVPVGNDRLAIGRDSASSAFICGTISKLNYWPQRLINAELQAFSKQG